MKPFSICYYSRVSNNYELFNTNLHLINNFDYANFACVTVQQTKSLVYSSKRNKRKKKEEKGRKRKKKEEKIKVKIKSRKGDLRYYSFGVLDIK